MIHKFQSHSSDFFSKILLKSKYIYFPFSLLFDLILTNFWFSLAKYFRPSSPLESKSPFLKCLMDHPSMSERCCLQFLPYLLDLPKKFLFWIFPFKIQRGIRISLEYYGLPLSLNPQGPHTLLPHWVLFPLMTHL